MAKTITLMITILLMLISITAYFYINQKIIAGEQQLSAGQQQYNAGEKKLAAGKRQLSAGKQKLSVAQDVYGLTSITQINAVIKNVPLADVVLNKAGNTIASGHEKVKSGEQQIRAGEAKLKAGKQQLAAGREKLAMAKMIREYLLYGAIFFAALTLLLAIFWRRRKTQ